MRESIDGAETGAFFSVNELLAVFPRLKRLEAVLSENERAALIKMEKTLYEYLSIEEIEKGLVRGGTGFPAEVLSR